MSRSMQELMAGRISVAVFAMTLLTGSDAVRAQHPVHDPAPAETSSARAAVGAHVVPLGTHISPIAAGASMTETYLTQPTLLGTASALGGALRVNAAISLEGLTLERGELGAGAHGEGYADRRHPHTYLHELMLTARHDFGGAAASLAAGRGFAPFGTDDPMMRPFVKFPVNHHLGQVLERLVVIAGVRAGPVIVEGALFNGNEPLDAKDNGSLERFGDSWAGRVTAVPFAGVELSASHAWIESPELPIGGGWDQRKWSASTRYEREHMFGVVYALAEWNRTTQVDRGTDVFSFGSVLAEAAIDVNGWRPALRLERAERPEEERLADRFRTPWPHGGGHVLGITEWTTASARIERAFAWRTFGISPFVEGAMSQVTETADGIFDPQEFYGGETIWTLSVGARLRAGWHPHRMGRYGVAATAAAPLHEH
jgi:hypothetical protein